MKLSDGMLAYLNYTILGLHILGVQSYSVVTLTVFLGHCKV